MELLSNLMIGTATHSKMHHRRRRRRRMHASEFFAFFCRQPTNERTLFSLKAFYDSIAIWHVITLVQFLFSKKYFHFLYTQGWRGRDKDELVQPFKCKTASMKRRNANIFSGFKFRCRFFFWMQSSVNSIQAILFFYSFFFYA